MSFERLEARDLLTTVHSITAAMEAGSHDVQSIICQLANAESPKFAFDLIESHDQVAK